MNFIKNLLRNILQRKSLLNEAKKDFFEMKVGLFSSNERCF